MVSPEVTKTFQTRGGMLMFRTCKSKWMAALCCAMIVGCAPQGADVDADDQPLDGLPDWAQELPSGKADDASGLTVEMGELGFGEDAALTQHFEGTARVHIYTVDLAEGDEVSFETTQKGSNRGVDTSLFLFAPQGQAGEPVDVIASDGDSGWGKLSRITSFTAPARGVYTLWVMKENTDAPNRYRLEATCAGKSCGVKLPVLSPEQCVFGPTIHHVLDGLGAVQPVSQQRLGLLDNFSALEERQLIAAVQSAYEDVTTVAEAFESVDQQEIYRHTLWDASSRTSFVAIRYWTGDNPYGAILDGESDRVVAFIQDGDLGGCTQPRGAEMQVCAQSADCTSGARCFGMYDGQGVCLDTSIPSPAGVSASCASDMDCGHPGLICAGEAAGGGFCTDAWMRRGFEGVGDASAEIPDGSGQLEIPISVYGLASVSTDVRVSLSIDHSAPETLRIRLLNPLGTEGVLHDGANTPIHLDDVPVFAFPGDEDANGTWTLIVEDDTPGDRGWVYDYTLKITSRFD